MEQNLEVVDLGLPSGTLWAKCNIGAEKETDFGKYFMFGDTEGRTADEVLDKPCSWETVPFNNGSTEFNEDYFNEHKHEFVNTDGRLLPKYDAAYKNTNGLMRMPTKEQLKELYNNTYSEVVTINEVCGMKFTSPNDNEKYIFIPFAGRVLNTAIKDFDEIACISALHITPMHGNYHKALFLGKDTLTLNGMCLNIGHLCGVSVRGVISK